MQLSKKAKEDLRKLIKIDVPIEGDNDISDEELNEIGELLLTILSEELKMKSTETGTFENVQG